VPVTLSARSGAIVRQTVRLRGTVPASAAGRRVLIQLLDGSRWTTIASARADRQGCYLARWRPAHIGRMVVRAVLAGHEGAAASPTGGTTVPASQERSVAPSGGGPVAPVRQLTVYRRATATWFGPGFYGKRTACGQILTHRLLGVAHRTLPCGTHVALYYRGRTIVVPVVDRGPFGNGASWDLTRAAADAIGMTGTVPLGALALKTPIDEPLPEPAPGDGAPDAGTPANGGTAAPTG
jgi:hypothetical protein